MKRGQSIIAEVLLLILALGLLFTVLQNKPPIVILKESSRELQALQSLVYADSMFIALTENGILQTLLGNPNISESLFYYDTVTNKVRVNGLFIPTFNETIRFYLSHWSPKGVYTCLLVYHPEDLQRLAIDPICVGEPPRTTVYCTTGWCTHLKNPDRLAYMVEYQVIPITTDVYVDMLSPESVIYLSTGSVSYDDLRKIVSVYVNTTGKRLMFISMYNTIYVIDKLESIGYEVDIINIDPLIEVEYELFDITYRCVYTRVVYIEDAVPVFKPMFEVDGKLIYPFYLLPKENILIMVLDEDHCAPINANYTQSYLLSELIYSYYEDIISRNIERYVSFTLYGEDRYHITLPDGSTQEVVHYYAFPYITRIQIYTSI